jgi:cytosolic iron-sulfur protein assembly protein CIAO1
MAPHLEARITPISSLTPTSLSRAWFSAPHPNQPILASCSSDKVVRIYSLTSFTLLSTISGGHKRSIRACAWKPGLKGESILATGSFDSSVGIWRHDDEPLHHTETDFTTGLSSGPNGAAQNDDESEGEEWRFALVLDGHDSEVKSVAWSSGGNLLATCARDKSVWIWEEVGEDDYETVAVLQEHTGDVKSVAWHPEEELLASGAYDDDVRLWRETPDDWECVALLCGHEGTVWMVVWEGLEFPPPSLGSAQGGKQDAWLSRRQTAGPRLASCSADGTVRIWRRKPREKPPPDKKSALSIIRTDSHMEEWIVEATLPKVHAGAVYAVSWSAKTGLIASTGDDGQVAVYKERWRDENSTEGVEGGDVTMEDAPDAPDAPSKNTEAEIEATEWMVVAVLDAAHEEYEVNHVTWARRTDKRRDNEDEEMLVTTGDDGMVKAWAFAMGTAGSLILKMG